MEPQNFGRYVIKAELGRGGMATVYHAYDPRFEREVALKVLPREMLHDPQFRARFEREAKTIAMLEHPAIVPVYDFGEEDGQPYFVMRFMTGGSLSDRMKKGPLSLQEVASLFDSIAPGLDEAHAKGIIHRDLKPGNILFDQYGKPYVSDFGIAKITTTEMNMTGSAIVGTPAYMSPEQAQGEQIDGRSDIYGLGVILFELLTGQQPYHGDTPMSVVVKQITEPVPQILKVKPDLPPAIEAVIDKAMAKNRDERFPTVRALADALQAVANGEVPDLDVQNKTMVASPRTVVAQKTVPESKTVLTPAKQVMTPVKPRRRTGLWIGLGGAALLLCIAALGVLALLGKKRLTQTTASQTPAVVQLTKAPSVQPATGTPRAAAGTQVVVPATGLPTPLPSPSLTAVPTTPGLPSLGNADLIAFLNNNNIWVIGVDGSNLSQLTKDGAGKSDLQWSPDGKSLFYINGTCIDMLGLQGGPANQLTCFTAARYLDAFQISPDGTQVAISLDRVLYIVPFDLNVLKKARTWINLRDMKGCFTYGPSIGVNNEAPSKAVQWSNDGKRIAVNTINPDSGHQVDILRIFDISQCDSLKPLQVNYFPATRNMFSGYFSHPSIPSFDWDGETLFVLNNAYRYEFGYLFGYNTATQLGIPMDPMRTSCCYTQGRFSPDGTYLLFAYQNINSDPDTPPQLYYIPYGTMGTGASYSPLNLPKGFFSVLSDHFDAALRPVKP